MYATPTSIQFLIKLLVVILVSNEIETVRTAFLINQNKTTNSAESYGHQERP
jgi:hypothetical protein